MDRPRILIWVNSLARFTTVTDAIDTVGLNVQTCEKTPPIWLDLCGFDPDLVVTAADESLPDPVGALRARTDAIAQVPVILIGTCGPSEPDAYLDPDAGQRVVRDMIATWTPQPNTVLDRLVETFGHDQIAGLARAFRDFLAESLATLGAPGAAATAHRVAGLAGTLGYRALGREWARLSDGLPDTDAAKRLSRKAIYEISRKFG